VERRRTIADELKAEGRKAGELDVCRQVLLRQLRLRFGKLPKIIVAAIERSDDLKQLNAWLDRVLEATTLEEVGITSAT
jgi:hypothetical protein